MSKNLIPKEFMRMTYKLQISDFKRQRRVIARFSNHTQQVERKGNCLLEIKGTRIFFLKAGFSVCFLLNNQGLLF